MPQRHFLPLEGKEDNDCKEQTELMKLVTLYLPVAYVSLLDELVEEGFYPNRAEAVRLAIRSLLSEHGKFSAKTDYKPPSKRNLAAIERLVHLQSRRLRILRAGGVEAAESRILFR